MKRRFENLGKYLSILALLVSVIGVTPAIAARPDAVSDQLSDSRPSTAANHTITVDMAAGTTWAATETMTVSLNSSAFDTTGFANSDANDYDVTWGVTNKQVVANGSCAADKIEITTVNTATDTFTFTLCSGSSASGAGIVVTIKIGTNATQDGTGDTQIVNATTGDNYQETIAGSYGDSSQDTALTIVGGVTLSVTLDETISTTVAGVTTGNCPDVTSVTETEINTSGDATTVPFGTITPNTFYGACQKLTISTNAAGGYTATVQTTTRPTAGSNTIAKGNCDGGCSDSTGAAWATTTNNGYGYCMSDSTGTPAATADGTNWTTTHQCGGASPFAKTIARADNSDTPQAIMKSTAGASADASYIKYRLDASGTQASGSYTTTLIYVNTGTF